MSQFTVYRNPGRNLTIPFVVQVQSSRIDRVPGRVVIPLVRRGNDAPPEGSLTPYLDVLGEAVYANPLDLATFLAHRLQSIGAVLPEPDQDRIMKSIDEMLSRA